MDGKYSLQLHTHNIWAQKQLNNDTHTYNEYFYSNATYTLYEYHYYQTIGTHTAPLQRVYINKHPICTSSSHYSDTLSFFSYFSHSHLIIFFFLHLSSYKITINIVHRG